MSVGPHRLWHLDGHGLDHGRVAVAARGAALVTCFARVDGGGLQLSVFYLSCRHAVGAEHSAFFHSTFDDYAFVRDISGDVGRPASDRRSNCRVFGCFGYGRARGLAR